MRPMKVQRDMRVELNLPRFLRVVIGEKATVYELGTESYEVVLPPKSSVVRYDGNGNIEIKISEENAQKGSGQLITGPLAIE